MSNRVAYYRAVVDLSQRALAKRAGLSPQTLARIEDGTAPVTLDRAEALALALGVPARALFPELVRPNPYAGSPDDSYSAIVAHFKDGRRHRYWATREAIEAVTERMIHSRDRGFCLVETPESVTAINIGHVRYFEFTKELWPWAHVQPHHAADFAALDGDQLTVWFAGQPDPTGFLVMTDDEFGEDDPPLHSMLVDLDEGTLCGVAFLLYEGDSVLLNPDEVSIIVVPTLLLSKEDVAEGDFVADEPV